MNTRLDKAKRPWAEQLTTILWTYRTTSRVSTRETTFNLVYGVEAVIPVEIEVGSSWIENFDEQMNQEALKENHDLIDEKREHACMRLEAYQQRIERYCNSQVRSRPMNIRDVILRKSVITNALRE